VGCRAAQARRDRATAPTIVPATPMDAGLLMPLQAMTRGSEAEMLSALHHPAAKTRRCLCPLVSRISTGRKNPLEEDFPNEEP